MKRTLFALLTIVISLIVALLIGELILRISWTPPSTLSTHKTEEHPIYSWGLRPGISGRHVTMEFDYDFSHTVQGFRGSELFTASRPEKFKNRVLFLGDSFTYGIGSKNADIFVEKVNSAMPLTEIINAGVNAYGQRQELSILDTLGASLQPDLVVLMFFWNDPEGNLKDTSPSFMISPEGRVTRTDLLVPTSFDPLAYRNSRPRKREGEKIWRKTYLYKLIKEGARGFRHRVFGGKPRKIQTLEQRDQAWAITSELLQLIKLRSEEIGSRLIIVSIPDYELVTPQGQLKGQKLINIETEDLLRKACADIDIECYDLLPELKARQSASETPFYFQTDRHLTPEGNAVISEILIPILADVLTRNESSTTQP